MFLRLGLFLVFLAPALAQTVSSTVKGSVQDGTGASVPNATCRLINTDTNSAATVSSAQDGSFQFLDVMAGNYRLTVSAAGFKTAELDALQVTASEFHSAGNIVLQVGQAAESIIVSETSAPVQTQSGERSDIVTGNQLNDIAVKGRDFFSYLAILPGIVDTNADTRDSMQRNANAGIHINGGRDTQTLLLVDGMPIVDSGNSSASQEPNMDAIAEVKVLSASYQAEYGRNGGGSVVVVTKSGSMNFHGSAYEYYRDEELDANNFFNNATNTQRPPYRYRMSGGSIGGPVLIPKLDKLKNKLFFFFSDENVGSLLSDGYKLVTTPTALERAGNFSQSKNVNGALITVKDPLTGKAFPGNIIPASRFDPTGQALLNFYPLPNYKDPNPANYYRYNYQDQYSGNWPRNQEVGRLDSNFWTSFQLYYRVMNDYSVENTPWGSWVNGSANYNVVPIIWDRPAQTHTIHGTKIFSASMVNEFSVGSAFNGVYIKPLNPSAVLRSNMGNPPQLFPQTLGESNWLPSISFGAAGGTPPNTVNASLADQLPEGLPCMAYVLTDNLSKVWKSHQIKAGFYIERNHKNQPASVSYRGTYSFATDANNPNNTGDPFANALLGDFDTYTQASNWPDGSYLFWNVEFYVQDNWRVTKRLTLDYGLRFYHMPATVDLNHTVATLDPRYYNPANAPVLYRPAKNAAGQRVAQNPITGALEPVVLIGQFVPGVGNTADGAKVGGIDGYPGGLYTTPALNFGPRFGFAYDLFGDGKTAVRGGFGMFKDRVQGNLIYNASGNPPVNSTPTVYYGTFASIAQGAALNASGTAFSYGPSNITEVFGTNPIPTIMNYNLGIQHQFGSTVIDVSYVGSISRHLPMSININPIPMFAKFNPQNFDPTQSGSTPLSNNFLVPYTGYANITDYNFGATSNYNALQMSARRRFSHGFQFGASYTFSKALGVASTDTAAVSSYFSPRAYNYGPLTFNRAQTLSINYLYDLPNVGRGMKWHPASWFLDNWELSGITTFQTGAPFTPGYSTTNGADISGSTDSARIEVIGNPYKNVPAGDFFNPAAFTVPPVKSFGNAGTNVLTGPGINNWDLSITKRFKFSESRILSFRGECFNVWNHTQFSGLYNTASFQPNGTQIDAEFAQPDAAHPARNIQISARFMF